MKSVAMVIDGCVYGVMLVGDDGAVRRAWIDPELHDHTVCVKMEFAHDDPNKALAALQRVLDVRPIPEVNVNEFHFDLSTAMSTVMKKTREH